MADQENGFPTREEHDGIPTTGDDDTVTACAISAASTIVANLLHEGVGHGLVALLTGAHSGLLTTVAWSSGHDSRLVAAGGTLVNLAAAAVFWFLLRHSKKVSTHLSYFFLTSCAFNLFTGTGYFLFSGVTNFGDWAQVIAGMYPAWLWRASLIVIGVISYSAAVRVVGIGIVRYVGVPRHQHRRLRKLLMIPYFTALFLHGVSGLLNPIGIRLVWQSALPATAGADSAMLWLQYYIPRSTVPNQTREGIQRSYSWILGAAVLGVVFLFVLGRGIRIHF